MSQGLLVTSWSDVWDFSSSLFNLEDTGSAGAEKIDGDIAQLGERLPCKQEVAGSIPTISTNFELKMDGSGQRLVRFDLVSKETGVCTLKTEQRRM